MMTEQPELEEPRRPLGPWVGGGVVLVATGILAAVILFRGRTLIEPLPLPRGDEHPGVGRTLASFELEPLTGDGPLITVQSLPDHVTFVNFWGTWCGPCIEEFPHLQELEQHFRGQPGFQFVSVSCTNDGADEGLAADTANFVRRMRVEFPTYHDADRMTRKAIMQTVGDFAYPTSLLIGRDGKIKAVWVGYAPGVEKQMREIIDRELQALPADVPVSDGKQVRG
jgi:thiol-disulfide isomerase/thioredoxin